MDTLRAFMMGETHKNNPLMVFDWDKAAQLIRTSGTRSASAGLAGDWEWTGGPIYRDGKPVVDGYCYLSSTWATPCLKIDEELIECWRYQSETPGWDAKTKWPDSAVAILEGGTQDVGIITEGDGVSGDQTA